MTGRTVPLDRLLGRLAAELDALEAAGGRVEAMVGDLVAHSKEPVPRGLQELDLMVQSVRDLAAFVAALSSTAPEIDFDLAPGLSKLKLRRLREELSGTHFSEPEEDVLF